MPPAVKRKVPVQRRQHEDIDLQRPAEALLNRLGIKFVRVPSAVWMCISPKNKAISPVLKNEIIKHLKGLPDLIVVSPTGKCILIELKSAHGKLTPEQKAWQEYSGNSFVVARTRNEIWLALLRVFPCLALVPVPHEFKGEASI